MSKTPLIFISGPTAVGKSNVALKLAQQLQGEIVGCDSMQVYKEINVASNKPSADDCNAVVHHLINITSVYDEFDVNQYAKLANKAIEDIVKRGKTAIVCGGTGLYMEALIDGVFEGPKADWTLRNKLAQQSLEDLHNKLKEVDLEASVKIHPNDERRIIRALEVFELTGKPISVWQKERKGLADKYDIKSFVLTRPRDELYELINKRVEIMVDDGLFDEVEALNIDKISRTAQQLIGIKESILYLTEEIKRDEAIDLIKQNSRNYAKRQLTWYRKDERNIWIDVEESDPFEEIKNKL